MSTGTLVVSLPLCVLAPGYCLQVVGVTASTVLAIPTAWAGLIVRVACVVYLHTLGYLPYVMLV